MLSYNRPSRKPTLFKPFTGPSVKQFDDFYKVIESEYARHEIKPYLIIRETERKSCWSWLVDDVSNWMLMSGYHYDGLGVLSSIYLTYILTGFMFDLGFLGVEKTFLNKNHHYLSRRKKVAS